VEELGSFPFTTDMVTKKVSLVAHGMISEKLLKLKTVHDTKFST